MEKDVLEVLSLSAFCRDEQDLEEKLRYCGENGYPSTGEGCADISGCISGHPVSDEAGGTKEAGGAEEGAV